MQLFSKCSRRFLEDRGICRKVLRSIILEEKLNAEFAVSHDSCRTVDQERYRKKISQLPGKGMMQIFSDVAIRLIRILSRSWKDRLLSDEPFIHGCIRAIYPSEAMQLEKSKVLGFVTRVWNNQFPYGSDCPYKRNPGSHRTG